VIRAREGERVAAGARSAQGLGQVRANIIPLNETAEVILGADFRATERIIATGFVRPIKA
jgi:hypothetical protein